jgi:hypothetical protein
MKFFFHLFANLFRVSLGKLLMAANFVICLLIFDWSGSFRYLDTPTQINCHIKPHVSIDFSICGGSESISVAALGLIQFLYFCLTFPSIVMTEDTLTLIRNHYPLWCYETFEFLYIPIFAVINTFYWLFLGDLIEMAHSAYLRNKPSHQILSIFSNPD